MPSRGRPADRAEHRHAAQTGIRTHCPEAAQATGIPPQPTGSVSRNLKTPITGPATRHRWAQGQQRLQNELSGHAYGSPQAAEDRALIGKEAVHAVGGLPMTLFRLEPHSHMNVSDDEHVVLDFDLAERFGYQPVVRRIDLTRFQRASKGSRQSTRGRRHNIIQGCGVRQNRLGNFIMRCNCAVHGEGHGQRFRGQIRFANRTHLRSIRISER